MNLLRSLLGLQSSPPAAQPQQVVQDTFNSVSHPEACSYLPDRQKRMGFKISAADRTQWTRDVENGFIHQWGYAVKPVCWSCNACKAIRVKTLEFKPSRSQARVRRRNADLRLVISAATVDAQRLELLMRHQAARHERVGWSPVTEEQAQSTLRAFTAAPLCAQEWAYYLGDKLVAVGLMSELDNAFLGRYYYYDPDLSDRSLGTFICVDMIDRAAAQGKPYAYLGLFVDECRSLTYKANFRPNQIRGDDGQWHDFR